MPGCSRHPREVLLVDRLTIDAHQSVVADVARLPLFMAHFKERAQRGAKQAVPARPARPGWMFLHPGAVLDLGGIEETTQFIQASLAAADASAGSSLAACSPYADTSLRDGFKLLRDIAIASRASAFSRSR